MLDSLAEYELRSIGQFSTFEEQDEIDIRLAKYDLEAILLNAEQAISQNNITSNSVGIWATCLVSKVSMKAHSSVVVKLVV